MASPSIASCRSVSTTLVLDGESLHIPEWVLDLDSFRAWVHSDDFPEKRRVCYLDGEVWIDVSKEQIFSHNQVKGEFTLVLGGLAKGLRPGRFFSDGMLVSNDACNFAVQPDGSFVSRQSLRAGRVRLLQGKREGYVELEGTPDMMLEIQSAGSVQKDTVKLFDLYWRAGIREYWLVDARGQHISFDIYRHTPNGYVATRKQAGWVKSAVLGKSFRLTCAADELGNPEYTLEVR